MKHLDSMTIDFFGFEIECAATDIKGLTVSDRLKFDFFTAELNGQKFLVAKYLGEPIGAMQMYSMLSRFKEISELEVMVYMDFITYNRRASYIKKGISFVVRDKQVFVPFLGTSLVKRCDSENAGKEGDELKISTQLLLLYYFYSENDILKLTEAKEFLGYSRMTISRSGRELIETKMFELYKDGNANILKSVLSKREIFEKLSERFTKPDKFIGYSTNDKIDSTFTRGGLDALAQKSMLDFGYISEYATNAKEIEVTKDYIDSDTAVKIYQWRYNPLLFSKDGCIDPLSIAISLKDSKDERVQICVEEMLEKFWRSRENK